jgi:uncharacterized protein (TIGR02099 family)
MLKKSIRIAGRTLKLMHRIMLGATLLLAFVCAGVILALRYWILPDIERFHGEIASTASRAIGLDVQIGKIAADWHGFGPRLSLSDIHILNKQKQATLALQNVELVVSWMTLFSGAPRLASLEINQPDLTVKRNVDGVLEVSGVQLIGDSADNGFANMLLNQSRIVVRSARISWLDEQHNKPLLVFDKVNLLIENVWNYHRFAMRAIPPSELSSQLDVRGDFYGVSFDEMQSWSGELFTQLNYADLAAWKTWLPLPNALTKGSGALRGWIAIEDGKIAQVTTDLALVDVQTRLASDVLPLDIRVLSGRMGWREVEQGFEITTRNLSLKLFNNFVLKPSDILVKLSSTKLPGSAFGEVQANLLELQGLGHLMEYLPLDPKFKKQFVEYSPQGRLEKLQATWRVDEDNQLRYQIAGHFDDLSMQRVGDLPGFSGLSGEVDGDESSGRLLVNSHNFKVDAPQVMQEAVSFDSFSAKLGWVTKKNGFEVAMRNVALSNSDFSGTAYGGYQTLPNGPGKLDLSAHISRASLPNVSKYIPKIALGDSAQHWLKEALLSGQSNDASIRIKGDLKEFPFVNEKNGIFKVRAHAIDAAIMYLSDWPKIVKGNAELLIRGKELNVNVATAITEGINLKNLRITIPDILSKELSLLIDGEAESDNAHALGFVNNSPVNGYMGGLTKNVTAQGNGKLKLHLDIPLSEASGVKVAGTYSFFDSEIELAKSLPTLREVYGDLSFSESGATTQNITANILGGPASLAITPGDGDKPSMHIKLEGKANLAALYVKNSQPWLSKLTGDPAWNLLVDVQGKKSKILFTSNLKGLQSDLPAPLDKPAVELRPVKFEMSDVWPDQKLLTLQYGSLLNANVLGQQDELGEWSIQKGLINFGNIEQQADKDGLWVIGTLPQVSLEGWGLLASSANDNSKNNAISLAGADLVIQKVAGYGNAVNDLHIKAASRNGVLMAQLAAKEINGDLSWRVNGGGRLMAHLKNLDLVLPNNELAPKGLAEANTKVRLPTHLKLPIVDMVVENLSLNGRQLGSLDLLAQQQEQVYLLEHLRLTNPDGLLAVDGKWNMSEDAPATEFNVKLDFANAGNVLARSGYPDSIKNGSGKLDGSFAWTGNPIMFRKDRLNGHFNLDTGKGQFLQIDPGMGKILSILSLQALPKRIALDFEDVFSKGFEFDKISGSADIKQGVIFTDDLKIEGSAAKVTMQGQMDLTNETQNMRVRIIPSVGNSAALISALVATPVIGAGVFIASKILNDPLGQLASFEYNISGSWIDPKVEKVGGSKVAK